MADDAERAAAARRPSPESERVADRMLDLRPDRALSLDRRGGLDLLALPSAGEAAEGGAVNPARIHIGDVRARRAVLDVLMRLPQNVGQFALRNCTFIGVGRSVRGMAVRSERTLVIIDESAPIEHLPATLAHEIAHAFLRHRARRAGRAERERAAARLAARWGFLGPGANPQGCAERTERAETARATAPEPLRESIRDGKLHVACAQCGQPCEVFQPCGLPDTAAVRCWRCDLLEWRDLGSLVVCQSCRVDSATSILTHAVPIVKAWSLHGWPGVLGWVRVRCPGIMAWARSGFRGPFSARWSGEDVLVACGTCGARSRLHVADECMEGAGLAAGVAL